MKPALIAAIILAALPITAAAEDYREITALDVALEADALQGAALKVTGCTIVGANLDFLMCSIKSKTGSVGNLSIDPEKLDRAQFKQALEKCAGLMASKDCRATIAGELGKSNMGTPKLSAKEIIWIK